MTKVLKVIGNALLIVIGAAGTLVGIGVLMLTIYFLSISTALLASGALEVGDELLLTSVSPTGAYELEVHLINPGATEPHYIHVLRTDGGRNERIYNVRGEEDAEVTWLSDEVVRINTVTLNVPAGETYKADMRSDGITPSPPAEDDASE